MEGEILWKLTRLYVVITKYSLYSYLHKTNTRMDRGEDGRRGGWKKGLMDEEEDEKENG